MTAIANALAESWVDSIKTELISDRVWRTRPQLELAVVEYIGWFNHERLHEALGDIPPVEFEQLHGARQRPISGNGSVVVVSPRAADGLTTRRVKTRGVDFVADGPISAENALVLPAGIRSGREDGGQGTNGSGRPMRSAVQDNAR